MKIGPPLRFGLIATLSLLMSPGSEAKRARSPMAPLAIGTWSSRGPGGGGALFSPAISPFDANEVFLMTDMTGVFHTLDFGDTWRTLDFRQIQGDPLGRVEFTSDRNVLYALSAQAQRRVLEKSTDAGGTFRVMAAAGLREEPRYLFASPDRSDTFVTADRTTVYLSRDGGASLLAAHACKSPPGCVLGGAFFDGETIYLGTSDGLLVSRRASPAFEADPRPGIPASERIVSFAGGGKDATLRLVALTYGEGAAVQSGMTAGDPSTYAGIYVLDPGADRWRRETRGIGSSETLGLVAMARADADTVYAAGKDRRTDHPVVYEMTTAGARWTQVFLTEGNANVDTGWSGDGGDRSWTFGEVALGLAVAPSDPKRVVVSDLGSAHASRDGGRTWQAVYVAPSDRNPRGAETPKGLTYATSGIEPTSVWALAWPGAGVLFADLADIQSARSVDGGRSWQCGGVERLGLNTTYDAVVAPDTGALYVAASSVHDLYESPYLQDARIDGGRGSVLVSMNAGESFDVLYDFHHPVVWLALDPTNARRLYASVVHSREGGIYAIDLRAPDAVREGGATRLPVPARTHGHPSTLRVLRDGTIVASYSGHRETAAGGARGPFTASSGVFVLARGTSTWEDVSLPAMEYWTKDVVVDPHDPSESTWYVGVFDRTGESGEGGLYRTRDRGHTWERISSESRVESCTVHPTNPSVLFMTTETDGLFVTKNLDDPSPVFAPVREYPFRQPLRLFFNPRNAHELWATSFGGGLRATLVE
jgi:hypothetical protein